ncbi:glutathione binding-like protein [Flocculibacter collagenilyticus]|uniref:glutathione binding-like protein n=1 Tax=Flocculibacter collagenilyticus TaxID=2744479 RepID=UPI0018F2BCEA|nr:glutathione binding-like protein [Flocculibacter collagenilyticus]
MIELYYFPTPNGHKITIMLEECGLAYKIIPINILEGDQFNEHFLKISPNNKIPAIVDLDSAYASHPINIFESAAILMYLGVKTGNFFPSEPLKRIQVTEWLMWQMGGFGPMLGQNHHFVEYATEDIPYAKHRYIEEAKRLYRVLDNRLKGRDYLCDEYSIADMAAFPWALNWEGQQININNYPHVQQWIDSISTRAAVKRALAIEDQFEKVDAMTDKQKSILFKTPNQSN